MKCYHILFGSPVVSGIRGATHALSVYDRRTLGKVSAVKAPVVCSGRTPSTICAYSCQGIRQRERTIDLEAWGDKCTSPCKLGGPCFVGPRGSGQVYIAARHWPCSKPSSCESSVFLRPTLVPLPVPRSYFLIDPCCDAFFVPCSIRSRKLPGAEVWHGRMPR